jgi:hypothetical protein
VPPKLRRIFNGIHGVLSEVRTLKIYVLFFTNLFECCISRDCSDRGIGDRFQRDIFSLRYSVETGFGPHSASYQI